MDLLLLSSYFLSVAVLGSICVERPGGAYVLYQSEGAYWIGEPAFTFATVAESGVGFVVGSKAIMLKVSSGL